MAKKKDSIHPIFIILAFFAFIIMKIFEFIIENIVIISSILFFALGIFLVYYIFNQRKNEKTKREVGRKSQQRKSVSIIQRFTNEKPKTMGSHELITDNNKIGVQTYKEQMDNNLSDETIIDIKNEVLDLHIEKEGIESNQVEVPSWNHSYVYSYDEIRYASIQQKKFYFRFRESFLNGKLIDIQGNTNYAFILYFDLLNEYDKHLDIHFLDEQFKLLGQICPKTKSYSYISFRDLLAKRTDQYSIDKLNNLLEPSYQFEHGYSDYDPDSYKLGKQYKDKLGLNKQEVALLNKFWNPTNVFISIEGCCIAVIKQYLLIIRNLNKILKSQNTSIVKEVDFFKEKVFETKEVVNNDWGYYDKSYIKLRSESEVYLTIFKRVENSVREAYGHKRKIGSMPYYDFKGEFETRIGNYVDDLILECQSEIELPNIDTLIELNVQNVNRWKIDFKKLTDSFLINEMNPFIDAIINLEVTNQKNPNLENIFYESSKFIAKYYKVQSLKLYAKYVYYDLKSKKIDNLQLTTTIQKSLFNTNEQLIDFQSIIEKLVQNKNIEETLAEISNIYTPKRKKIVLDKTEIKEVEKKHIGTVELLNEILVNDTDEFEVNPIQNDKTNEEFEISFGIKANNNLLFKSEIDLNKVQEQLVLKITKNSFSIHQNEVEKFALDNGLFKNQLVDSINEICSKILEGEALIEEEEDNYIIDESYYLEIVN